MGLGYDYGICTNYDDFILLTMSGRTNKVHKFNFHSIKDIKNHLNEDKLKEFIGIFSKQRIFAEGIVERLTNASLIAEQEFTDEFYKLFHETRLMLIKEFSSLQGVSKDEAIHWAQIYLNRLIFVFFVEDHNFIPDRLFAKRILSILKSPSISEHTKIISENINDLFKIMNTGSKIHGVNGFNGGLFEKEIPSKIFFNDTKDSQFFKEQRQNSKLSQKSLLVDIDINLSSQYADFLNPIIKNLLIMDSFDFTSDLNVNILGHIFEQSISDLEEIKEGGISKRKKEGVYYTPEYITDYICRNTIIPYLSKKNVTSVSELVEEYADNIKELEKKIKNIKILDPACGSGAFLVKAVDILLEIDERIQLYKPQSAMAQRGLKEYSKVKEINLIVESNIFGVDINPESVEITKLSLFLKLAGPNTKLSYLSNNIKIGNSLIDDKAVDKKAFCWSDEFPEILSPLIDDKGFDIVIGNPPYGRYGTLDDKQKVFLKDKNYLGNTADISESFIRMSIDKLVKNCGFFSFIIPKGLSYVKSWSETRISLLKNNDIKKLIDASQAFDEVLYEQIIFVLRKQQKMDNVIEIGSIRKNSISTTFLELEYFNERIFPIGITKDKISILKKIEKNTTPVRNLMTCWYGKGGMTPNVNYNGKGMKLLTGKEISKYGFNFEIEPWYLEEKYLNDTDLNRTFIEKVVVQDIVAHITKPISHIKLTASLDRENRFCLNTVMCFSESDKECKNSFLLALINSKFMSFYYYFFIFNQAIRTMHFMPGYADYIPIPKNYKKLQDELSVKSEIMLTLTSEFNSLLSKFFIRLKTNFGVENISEGVYSFYNLDFIGFIRVSRLNKKLSLKQQDDLQEYFDKYKKKLSEIKNKLNDIDIQINESVYRSYDLTYSEIQLIEKSMP